MCIFLVFDCSLGNFLSEMALVFDELFDCIAADAVEGRRLFLDLMLLFFSSCFRSLCVVSLFVAGENVLRGIYLRFTTLHYFFLVF